MDEAARNRQTFASAHSQRRDARIAPRAFADIHAVYSAMMSTAEARGGIPGQPTSPDALLAFAKAYPLAVEWIGKPWHEFVRRHLDASGPLAWISALSGYVTDDASRANVGDIVPLFGYYFKGGYYPKNGSGAIAESMVKTIELHGGRVHLRTPVTSITNENGIATGVIVSDHRGESRPVAAKAVICNGDVREMLEFLIRDPAVAAALEEQVGPLESACSAIGVSLGLRGNLDLPPIVHIAAPDGGAGLVIPSAVDPTAAPEGYSTVEILELVGSEEARTWLPDKSCPANMSLDAWRRSPQYEARKRVAGDRLIARARLVIPDIAERIVYRCDSSPVTYQRYSWTRHGAIYGSRGARAKLPSKMPLRNLVIAGAATHGPGVEAVVMSGAYAAEALRPGLLSRPVAERGS